MSGRTRGRVWLSVFAVVVVAAVVGVASWNLFGAPDSPERRQVVFVDRIRSYSSLEELARDSTTVVQVTATKAEPLERPGLPTMLATVRVDDVLHGDLARGDRLRIRQTGSVDRSVDVSGAGPLLEEGKTYLLYLNPFVHLPGRETGQWVVTGGGAGTLGVHGRDSFATLDQRSLDLPAIVDRGAIVASLAG